jgi:hypothetical protein
MLYGVLLPTLPPVPRALAWGGLLMPLVWTGLSFLALGAVNPALQERVGWPWFVASQFIFGVVLGLVMLWAEKLHPITGGLLGGAVGGALMPLPAVLWSLANGKGLWYPVNLLAGMLIPNLVRPDLPPQEIERILTEFHGDWLATALVIHGLASLAFGAGYGLILPKLGRFPGPLAWGGLVMPMLWTSFSFGLMGVVNPLLQQRVDWPWFIASQFVFGLVAAYVVVRSEKVYIPPAGAGPDRVSSYVTGERRGQP